MVTGNYERHELNAFMAKLWAQYFQTHIVRWKKRVKLRQWENKPAPSQLDTIQEEACFWEYFVPMAPYYLTYNINVDSDLDNGNILRGHSLSFNSPSDELSFKNLRKNTPITEFIDLPSPPAAVNVEMYPDFDTDDDNTKREHAKKRKAWKLGSLTNYGRIITHISIDHQNKVKWCKESIRARGGNLGIRASTVPIAEFFPLELGF